MFINTLTLVCMYPTGLTRLGRNVGQWLKSLGRPYMIFFFFFWGGGGWGERVMFIMVKNTSFKTKFQKKKKKKNSTQIIIIKMHMSCSKVLFFGFSWCVWATLYAPRLISTHGGSLLLATRYCDCQVSTIHPL